MFTLPYAESDYVIIILLDEWDTYRKAYPFGLHIKSTDLANPSQIPIITPQNLATVKTSICLLLKSTIIPAGLSYPIFDYIVFFFGKVQPR